MTHGEYILAAYLLSGSAIGGYIVRVLLRGRSLSRQVPPEDRRWT